MPLGSSIEAAITAQRSNGEAARMVLYRYDFIAGSAALKRRGSRQLDKIAARLPTNSFAVIIQPSGVSPDLDAARRKTVIKALAGKPFQIPDERVVVGAPISRALDGTNAEMVNQNQLQLFFSGSYERSATSGGPTIGGGSPASSAGFGSPGN